MRGTGGTVRVLVLGTKSTALGANRVGELTALAKRALACRNTAVGANLAVDAGGVIIGGELAGLARQTKAGARLFTDESKYAGEAASN